MGRVFLTIPRRPHLGNLGGQGGLATAFDLAAFRLSMIAPVKKPVNHPKTVASMRGTGWENNKFVLAASSQRFGSVKCSCFWSRWSLVSSFCSSVMWSLRFPFFWSCVCH